MGGLLVSFARATQHTGTDRILTFWAVLVERAQLETNQPTLWQIEVIFYIQIAFVYCAAVYQHLLAAVHISSKGMAPVLVLLRPLSENRGL